MKKMTSKKVLGVIALALVCVMTGTVIGMNRPAAQAETVVLTSPFTAAIAEVRDSVVGVNNYQIVSNYSNGYGNGGSGSYGNGSGSYGFPWDYFFGYGNGGNSYGDGSYGYGNGGNGGYQQPNTREEKYGSGSGVVIAEEYVLTNYHVIDGASSLKISIGDDEENLLDAVVAAYDENKDVAVLYVPGLELKPVKLGDSDSLQVGDWVVAIGNAIGFTRTATAGIVSAMDRQIESDNTTTDRFGRKQAVTNTMIQTDAAINSGNSGGGLFNTAGELIGIPTLKYSGTRYSGAAIESIGMCIPINEAKPVIEQALNTDKKEIASAEKQTGNTTSDLTGKPRLGVLIRGLRGAELTGGAIPNGVYIVSVEENGPAAKAGLQAGDILVEINGNVISTAEELTAELLGKQAGDVVTVTVWRPDVVTDAENLRFSYDGDYVEGIEVTLEVLEEMSNT